MQALAYTLGAFGLILVLARVRVPLSLAILGGTAAVGALFRVPAGEMLRTMLAGAVEPMTVWLVAIVIVLLALSETMRSAGRLDEIVRLARATLRRPAIAMAALPALIGLLPMPGGALFSAPMVESAAGEDKPSGARLSAVNYWFRHVWEFWWPLYPGVLLAVSMVGEADPRIGMGRLIAFHLPLTVFMATSGLWILRGMHRNLRVAAAPPPPGTKRRLLAASMPIWGVLVVWAGAKALMGLTCGAPPVAAGGGALSMGERSVTALHRFAPIAVGLVASLAWTVGSARLGAGSVARTFRSPRIYSLALLVLSVMVFHHVLAHVRAPRRIAAELDDLNVPVELVVAILPLIGGLVTGLAVGFVGTSFPIVLGLVTALPGRPSIQPYVALAYAFGHLGQMLSPLHLCQVLSNRYFHIGYASLYRRILPSVATTAALATGYFLLLRALMR